MLDGHVLQELESKHQGQHILLVSHGDTLSILQATFLGSPLTQHRQYGLATAELKCLNPASQAQLQSHVCGSAGVEGCSREVVGAAAAGVEK